MIRCLIWARIEIHHQVTLRLWCGWVNKAIKLAALTQWCSTQKQLKKTGAFSQCRGSQKVRTSSPTCKPAPLWSLGTLGKRTEIWSKKSTFWWVSTSRKNRHRVIHLDLKRKHKLSLLITHSTLVTKAKTIISSVVSKAKIDCSILSQLDNTTSF